MAAEKKAVAAVKAAENRVVEAEKTLSFMSVDTQTPFMDVFDEFFNKYSICRLQYFGYTLEAAYKASISTTSTLL